MDNLLPVLVFIVAIGCSIFLLYYFTGLITASSRKAEAGVKDQEFYDALSRLDEIIKSSVVATNQKFVLPLKQADSFFQLDKEEAFYQTFSNINNMLKEKDASLLTQYISDIETWISSRIEYYVRMEKGETP